MSKQNRTFEETYQKLTETVRAMESPDVSLEDSMRLYEEAGVLVIECEKILKSAKSEIVDIHQRLRELRERELGSQEES